MEIRNNSKGGRVLNRDTGQKRPDGSKVGDQFFLGVGATTPKDFVLLDENDPVFRGFVESGDLSVDGGRSGSRKEEDALSKQRDELNKRKFELDKQQAELDKQREELRHMRNPMEVTNREAAMIAGTLVADPLPPGTDTKGGKESEEALKRAGVDPKTAQSANPATGGADAKRLQDEASKARQAQDDKAKQAQNK